MGELERSEADEEQLALATQLGNSSLFEGMGPEVLHRVVGIGSIMRFSRNQFIFNEGDEGDKVYLILEGAVRISRQVPGMGEEALAVLRKGSAFGEMALIDGGARSADALAHEEVELFVIEKAEMERLMFVDLSMANELLWKMVRILVSRLRETNDKMTFLSVTGRF